MAGFSTRHDTPPSQAPSPIFGHSSRTTVVVCIQRSVFEQTVMAEFEALCAELTATVTAVVDHLGSVDFADEMVLTSH